MTSSPRACNRGTTRAQLDPLAQAPCTSTMAGASAAHAVADGPAALAEMAAPTAAAAMICFIVMAVLLFQVVPRHEAANAYESPSRWIGAAHRRCRIRS